MIELPSTPAPNGATPALVDFGGFNTPPLGGEVQRIDRLGNRFRLAVTMPPMPSATTGRIFVSRLIRGKTEGVRMEWPLLGFDPGIAGQPTVDGSGQAGRFLNIKGGTPGYVIREGQFFSIMRGTQHFMHQADAQVVLGALGTANAGKGRVPLSPMLRVPFADGDAVVFGKPMIEGYILGQEWPWEMQLDHNLAIQFQIEERR